jgi:methylglutaconyl-CoA hydratase
MSPRASACCTWWSAAASWLYLLAKAGPQAQREAKQLALRVGGSDVAQAERIDAANAALIARLRVSDEGQHGLGAFLDKRAPRWVAQP